MRKYLSIVLILFIPALILSCTKNKNADKPVRICNPIKECSAQDVLKVTGTMFAVPEEAQNIRYFTIGTDMAQMTFIWKNTECIARLQKNPKHEQKDISGFYYQWTNEIRTTIGRNPLIVKWVLKENAGVCCWWDNNTECAYSVSMINNAKTLSSFNLMQLANLVYLKTEP